MIAAKFYFDREYRMLTLTVKGHADYAEHGKDIVCSAATILTYMVAQEVIDADNTGKLDGNPQVTLEEGDSAIACSCNSESSYDEMLGVFRGSLTGFKLLSNSYSDHISVVWDYA